MKHISVSCSRQKYGLCPLGWVGNGHAHHLFRNRESGAHQGARTAPPPNVMGKYVGYARRDLAKVNQRMITDVSTVSPPSMLHKYEGPAQRGLTQVEQCKVDEHSSTPPTQRTKKQGVDSMLPLHFYMPRFQCCHTPVAKKLNSILKWLHAWSCTEIYEHTLLLWQPDTCIWLPNMNAFKTWRNTESSFLWLHGKGMLFDQF